MRQLVHILQKDCRHLWPAICAVLVLVGLHAYGDVTSRGSGGVAVGLSPFTLLYTLVALSAPLLVCALLLLVALVMQEEAAVGSEQFWLTRPYDRTDLLLEKLVFLALFAGLPLLLHDIAVLLCLRFSLSTAVPVLLWKQAQLWVFLLIAATIAGLTRSLAQFAMAVIGTEMFAMSLTYVLAAEGKGAIFNQAHATVFLGLSLLLLFGTASVVLIGYQYLLRRTKVAVVLALACIFFGFMVARWWPQRLTAYLEEKSAPAELRAVRVVPYFELQALNPSLLSYYDNEEPKQDLLVVPFKAIGLADDIGLTLPSSLAQLKLASGGSIPFASSYYVSFQPQAASPRFFGGMGPVELVPLVAQNGRAFAELGNQEGLLTGQLLFEGYRSSRVTLPLRSSEFRGEPVDIGQEHCRMTSLVRDKRADVTLSCVGLNPGRVSQLQARLNPEPRSGSSSTGTSQTGGGLGTWPSFFSPISWVTVNWQFEHQPIGLPHEPPEPAGERSVDIYLQETIGSVVRNFQVENFRAAEYNWAAWQQRALQTSWSGRNEHSER